MRIKRICYPIKVLGPGKRVGIWVTGCNFNCVACSSPELQNFNAGTEICVDKIIEIIKNIGGPVDGFTISGGEPFEQFEELLELVTKINNLFNNNDIIIYTGYKLEELKNKYGLKMETLISNISVIIDGRYIDELNSNNGLKGSTNQKIYCFNNYERYRYMERCKREVQSFDYKDNSTLLIGIL